MLVEGTLCATITATRAYERSLSSSKSANEILNIPASRAVLGSTYSGGLSAFTHCDIFSTYLGTRAAVPPREGGGDNGEGGRLLGSQSLVLRGHRSRREL
eukprot:scaffold130807_cov30-Tisochrysis_lutea.AAC.3